ncbi:hypothetical protein [Psychromonas aquimarina]|uniref:hypothetical protein n=1 Tax=Psychromonas aquimarina TaxID=444919 RepID=UPI00040D7665|nr:hypothetical protein [Psychromonas aquimarina]
MAVRKKISVPKILLAVAWIPDLETKPLTIDEVLNVGGRVVDENLSKLGAEEVERCLNIGTEGLDGEYIII